MTTGEVIALIKAFGGSGGGSSGGGVLVANFTPTRDGWTCDKTYAEIVSAITGGTPVIFSATEYGFSGNAKYSNANSPVTALFFEISESTMYVMTLTIDSSNSVSDSTYSISMT